MNENGLNEAAANVATGLQRPALAPVWLAVLVGCLDLPVFAAAFWFAQYAALPAPGFDPRAAAGAALIVAAVATGLLALGGGYAPDLLRRPWRAILRTALALAPAVLVAAFLLAQGEPSDLLGAAALALAAGVIPLRVVESHVVAWIVDTGLIQRRAVIAGGGEHAERLIRGLAARSGTDVRLYGIFDDRDDLRSPPQVLGVPKIGDYDDLVGFIRRSEVDMVIISLPLDAEERINWLLAKLKVLPVEVRLSAFSADYAFPPSTRDPLISAIRGTFAPERRLMKRAFDIVFATLALLLVWPVMLAAAIAIRLESGGPVFFRQKRHGYNDRVIDVLKFRSMYPEAMDPTARRVVTRHDPRVTRVGRILRRSSIDELPQLFNVLRGGLSMVGPRPHAIDALSSRQERFTNIVDDYSARHRLPPGITGWAQIHGHRGEVDVPGKLRDRFEHDLYYIENWSIWLDLKILLRTPLSLVRNPMAY
ncbi:exopolysaccharide biosynthesis polyprenyl glycosylphosphotransferase [Pararhodobacter sp. SW119]|uniref:exopolysaccharide biosynthesis polyprenyl glycosylphosphotransferase n=1 Tax=Pararhodobacter sp. SW119 TaxID=2780075 RepID=UPI001ADF2A6A|nr:exopolysaccharide biosynthesis polyprenyl glycosylphosphotransferase [Pararhodobacter sp. SW119]